MSAEVVVGAYRDSGFFVLRTPLLPWSAWAGLTGQTDRSGGGERASDEMTRRAVVRSRMSALVCDANVREALLVASPAFEAEVDEWLTHPGEDSKKKVEHTLTKYLARMAGRCTPFGLFAGCSTGRIGQVDRLELPSRSAYLRHVRVDGRALLMACERVAGRVSDTLRYRTNEGSYLTGGRLHYVEGRWDGPRRSYTLASVEPSEALETLLTRARTWATRDELANALVDLGVPYKDALAFVDEAIGAQLLAPEIGCPLTGDGPLDHIVAQWRAFGVDAAPEIGSLETVQARLRTVDATTLAEPVAHYGDLAGVLIDIGLGESSAELLQVDLTKPSPELVLGGDTVRELLKGVQVLHDLFGRAAGGEQQALTEFMVQFGQRFGDNEVLLVDALDDETGVGFGGGGNSPTRVDGQLGGLVRGIRGSGPLPPVTPTVAFLQQRVIECLARGQDELELREDELAAFRNASDRALPDAFEAWATLIRQGSKDPGSESPGLVLLMVRGPSGACSMGRFCHADSLLRQNVERHLADEEQLNASAIYCEIVHLPDGLAANVGFRPVLRQWELPYLGVSGAPSDRQLALTDLLVRIHRGRIVLRSRSLNREVIPRLTSAHNTVTRTLPMYRFLAALQWQGCATPIAWDWGPLAPLPFLPQVRSGRVVLARRQWTVPKDELLALVKHPPGVCLDGVREWRRSRKLPQHLGLVEGDNVLPIDFENPLSVDAFVALANKRASVVLADTLPGPAELVVRGPEGLFCNEVIVPFVRKSGGQERESHSRLRRDEEGNGRATLPADPSRVRLQRIRPPGSDWMSVKLFCGIVAADRILREDVAKLVESLGSRGLIDGWFFLRHNTNGWHIRLRFHGRPPVLMLQVMPEVLAAAKALVRRDVVWNVMVDTYDREVRRYGGGHGTRICERVFQADSLAVLSMLRLPEAGSADERWCMALAGMARLMSDWGMDACERCAFARRMAGVSAGELQHARINMRDVLLQYRKSKGTMAEALAGIGRWRSLHDILDRRSKDVQRSVRRLQELDASRALSETPEAILASVLHLHVNRVLRGDSRIQEAILYQCLDRVFVSELARQAHAE